ncbi:putative Zn-dependent protease-like protein [Beggiatoa alba B18LD]|uniref:Putative Zn-dependent protease-like protein n=1 Tax=Beggiatoa alba B18LD TaxID=395493 RepID=I3CCG3_9GAMM|nr:metalloprotease PmbA [Beggiatoa alba]EIJ41306.1 putative Zn-dependent protease-like protein [Beggiatoa alba B18LD]
MQAHEFEQRLAHVLEKAKHYGASSAEASLRLTHGQTVTVRQQNVDTIEHHQGKSFAISVYMGQQKGSAGSNDLSETAIEETIQAACDIARHTQGDEYIGLADANLMATQILDLDLYHPWTISTEEAIELAKRMEHAACAVDTRIKSSADSRISKNAVIRYYGNTHGFIGGWQSTRHSLNCRAIAQESPTGQMQRDSWYTASRDPQLLDVAENVGRIAAERALRYLNPRSLPTQQAPILFSAPMAVGLIGHLISAIQGASLYRKASFLLDTVGEQIFSPIVNIRENPHLLKGLASAPFDGEGVATKARELIRGGVLQGYILDSYTARRLGLQTTGNAGSVFNLTIDSTTGNLDSLLQQLGTGLYVTELMGQGVNLLTGHYSRGASGFWVENGVIQYPVQEITIAGNLKDMFQSVQAIGNDLEKRGSVLTGSWLLAPMTIAGH